MKSPDEVMGAALRVVDEQAEDEGLWFLPEYASEAYLQRLTAMTEANTLRWDLIVTVAKKKDEEDMTEPGNNEREARR